MSYRSPELHQLFSLEEELIVRCARTEVNQPGRIDEIVREDLDWEAILSDVKRHGTAQLMYRALSEYAPSSTPEKILNALREQRQLTTQRTLQYTIELVEVLKLLESNGIRAIPYRGPALASIGYDDVSLRSFGDLDLLVDRSAIPEIKSLLLDRGYEPHFWRESTKKLSESQEWSYTKFCRDYPFYNFETGVEIELHWRVISVHFPTSIVIDSVWDRREFETIAGHDIPVLSMEDRMLMMCVHGSRHHWERLQWITDVAEVMHRAEIDWSAVMELADEHNCTRMVALGPLLAHDLFGTPLPPAVHERLNQDPQLQAQREERLKYLFDPTYPTNFDTQLTQAKMLERRRDKVDFWLRWAVIPDRPSIERVSLPFPLVFLYPLVRMNRLLKLGLQRLMGLEEHDMKTDHG